MFFIFYLFAGGIQLLLSQIKHARGCVIDGFSPAYLQ